MSLPMGDLIPDTGRALLPGADPADACCCVQPEADFQALLRKHAHQANGKAL